MIAYHWIMNCLLKRSKQRPYPKALADFANEILSQFPGSKIVLNPSPLLRIKAANLAMKRELQFDRRDLRRGLNDDQ